MLALTFRNQAVRDLAWVMASPSLLAEGAIASGRLVTDAFSTALYARNLEWLQQLDHEPAPLEAWLRRWPSPRLGRYFECLVEFWLRNALPWRFLVANLCVASGAQTRGEFDFLMVDDEAATLRHWEVAVKYYLWHENEQKRWYGPNSRDRFDLKFKKLFEKQLLLGITPEGAAQLANYGRETLAAAAFVKGYLFLPATLRLEHIDSDVPINPAALRGWWYHYGAQALPDADGETRWCVLPRLRWLSPAVISEAAGEPLFTTAQAEDHLSRHFVRTHKPLLLAGLRQSGGGEWREQQRGFVVAADWPRL